MALKMLEKYSKLSKICFSLKRGQRSWSTITLYFSKIFEKVEIWRPVSIFTVDDTGKGHAPNLKETCTIFLSAVGRSYWLSEVRPPLDPGTDPPGTWGMRSWLAGEEISERGILDMVRPLAPSLHLRGECATITHTTRDGNLKPSPYRPL